jgi:hypothetical protein
VVEKGGVRICGGFGGGGGWRGRKKGGRGTGGKRREKEGWGGGELTKRMMAIRVAGASLSPRVVTERKSVRWC